MSKDKNKERKKQKKFVNVWNMTGFDDVCRFVYMYI